MTPKSFSVRVFLQDGHAGGVRIISKSKWSGRGLVIPQNCFAEEKARKELKDPGLYLLNGLATATKPATLWIGAADPVNQLEVHDTHGAAWSSAIVFTCKENSLEYNQYQHIACRLVELGQGFKEMDVYNSKSIQKPKLGDTDEAAAEAFLAHILSLCPLLGVTAFEN